MALSLCFLGNSHIAAIKQAWTNCAPAVAPGVSVTFFSAGTHLLQHLRLKDGVWLAGSEPLREKLAYTSDGLDRIALKTYDAFVVFGSGFGLDIPKICAGYDLAGDRGRPVEGAPLSRAAFAAMIEAHLEGSLAITMIDTIKSVSGKPVLRCAAPFLSERVLGEEEEIRSQKRFQDPDFLAFVVAAAKAAGTRIGARHGHDVMWQEESTVGVPGFTKREFGINPVRFAMKGFNVPPTDRKHGNEEYGLVMLIAVLRRLHELCGGGVLGERPAPVARQGAPRSKRAAVATDGA
jgi:hypothetical protein